MPNEAVEALRHAYTRWHETKGGSADLFLDLFDERVEMQSALSAATRNPLAGSRQGRDAARQYLDALHDGWEMIAFPTHRIVSEGDTVVWIGSCHWRNRATGAEVDCSKVDVWTFAGGKAIRYLEMYDTLAFAGAVGLV